MTSHTANRRSGRYRRSPYRTPELRKVCRLIVRFADNLAVMGRQMTATLAPALVSLTEMITAIADTAQQYITTEETP